LASIALISEPEAKHRRPYAEAIRDISKIDSAHVVDLKISPAAKPNAIGKGEVPVSTEGLLDLIGDKLSGAYDSVEDMLTTVRPEMAIVTMVAVNAPPVIKTLLNAGVPVMAEKPACIDPVDFEPLVRLADEKGVPLMLALANRRRPDYDDAHRIVTAGGIGDLYAVQAHVVADQARIHRQLDEPDWTFQQARAGGGHLVWLGIHYIDVIRYITGLEIEQVQAMSGVVGGTSIDVEDLALVNMRLSGGVMASLFSGYLTEGDGHGGITAYGSRGWLRVSESDANALEWVSSRREMYASHTRRSEYVERGGGYTVWVEETLRACLGEIELPITAADSLTALRVVHAAYRSAESGKSESIPSN